MSYPLNNLLQGTVSGNKQLVGEVSIGVYSDRTSTYILVDADGNEIPAVLLDEEVTLTATAATDIREGTTAITSEGLVTGEKQIPAYYVNAGYRIVTNGSKFAVTTPRGEYAKFQALICPYDKTPNNSVKTERVVIDDNVYEVLSTEPIATVIKKVNNDHVDLGITNNSGSMYLIRYFMYREEF